MRMRNFTKAKITILTGILFCLFLVQCKQETKETTREKISFNEGWKFFKYPVDSLADKLIYDARPEVTDPNDAKVADSKPTEAVAAQTVQNTLKAWILPSGNAFIKDPQKHYQRPAGNPGEDFPFVQLNFDDQTWQDVNLPHDWAINGPFQEGWNAEVGGGMGRLPSPGIAWYRKKLELTAEDAGKKIFMDIDGAMSYAMVWVNGNLAGGWPYGYASWRVDLTPYLQLDKPNQIAIRLDNPNNSARWYPGGGIYRNVWITKTNPVHIGQWGTFIHTSDISQQQATLQLETTIDNSTNEKVSIETISDIYELDAEGNTKSEKVGSFAKQIIDIEAGKNIKTTAATTLSNPKLWRPQPNQTPHLYVVVTYLLQNGKPVDQYKTTFGIRSLRFDADSGLFVNNKHIYLQGANQHHDLGALGAAFNYRAAERQLEILKELGCNAIRLAHNPPAPELLELTDKMGFLVIDEIFDCWERKKTPHDFHLIFPDWHEQDTRSFIQRDRNHPSVIMWSLGNEVGEQYTGDEGAALAKKLHDIAKDSDPTRPTTLSMNFAKPPMPLPGVMDIINLNYQGEGIRDAPAYMHLNGIRTTPLYPSFHETYPEKLIISSENASALSRRGAFIFPVADRISAPAEDGKGADPKTMQVSAYELYTAQFGASPDKVFASLDQHPYVGGGFVWSGWDYLGEPTPYYLARSSYCGVIDLAGFKKERFYLYQSKWRPDMPIAHIIPHWNWPGREGLVTPVHLFTSGDEAELYLNGQSMGRKKKGPYEYRLRWDSICYQPGELKAIVWKNGNPWTETSIKTTESADQIILEADRTAIQADGTDLSFVTVRIADKNGLTVPTANNRIECTLSGPGEIIATDNGDPADFTAFNSTSRKAFNGLALIVIRSKNKQAGEINLLIQSEGLKETTVKITSK